MLLVLFLMLGALVVVELAEAAYVVPPGAGVPRQGRNHLPVIHRPLVFDQR
jgi:hypothetical protein